MKYLQNLSTNLENDINELKTIYEKINEKKGNLKLTIQKIFTEIRNIFNNREDELLLNVDKKFDEFFNEKLIKESGKLPNKVKISLEKGKIEESDWNDKKKLSLIINNCINIENNIKDIKTLIEKIQEFNSIKKFEFKFTPEKEKLIEDFEKIKNFGNVFYYEDEKEAIKLL